MAIQSCIYQLNQHKATQHHHDHGEDECQAKEVIYKLKCWNYSMLYETTLEELEDDKSEDSCSLMEENSQGEITPINSKKKKDHKPAMFLR